jgi:membrane protein CcdC involved in cytochrome C biogenesis
MDSKAFRFVLVTAMTAVMVLVVTLVATIVNLGFVPGFFWQWFKSYIVSWPVAAVTGFLVMPAARRLTGRIMSRIGAP